MPLGFEVNYSSAFVAGGIVAGAMGANRRHNFEWKLEREIDNFSTGEALAVKVTADRGRVVRFERRTLADKWSQAGRLDEVFGLMEEEGIFYFFTPAAQRVLVFDADGKLTKVMDGPGNTHTLTYAGRTLTSIADGLGRTLAITTASGRITRVTDHTGRHIDFAYTGANMTSATDPLGHATTFAYDGAGLLTSFTRPAGNTPFTQVFTGGRVTSQTERGTDTTTLAFPDAATMTLTYDGASNITRALFTDGHDFVSTYDNLGRLASVNDASVAGSNVTFTCDAESRLTRSQQSGVNFDATYDDGGRLKTVSCNGVAVVVTCAYDSRDRLTGVSDNVSSATIGFNYDDAGRPLTMTRANGVTATCTYDAVGRITRIQHGGFIDAKYTRNAAGEIVAEDRTAPEPFAVTAGVETLAFDKAGQAVTAGFAHDPRGRRTSGSGLLFVWDDADRLETFGSATLGYNALGDFITRTQLGVTTRFFRHHAIARAPIVAERAEATMSITRYYVLTPGGALLYSIDAGTGDATYYHADQPGSTLALTNEMGVVTDSYAHGPFGEGERHTGPSTQPFTWLGTLGVRKEGPIYQMGARYYDPTTAAFLTRDPVPPRLDDVKSLNPCSYANQNPLRYVDPEGGIVVQAEGVKNDGGIFGDFTFLVLSLAPDVIDPDDLPYNVRQIAGDGRSGRSHRESYARRGREAYEASQKIFRETQRRAIVMQTAVKLGGTIHSHRWRDGESCTHDAVRAGHRHPAG